MTLVDLKNNPWRRSRARYPKTSHQEELLSFQCGHCRNHVPTHPLYSGVVHRNHCPYCLWSKHLDHLLAGDRLSACKGLMHPVGLSLKRDRNKYGGEGRGELMLVHLCTACGKVSLNRIAADDDVEELEKVFWRSNIIKLEYCLDEIPLLGEPDYAAVRERLFGRVN